VRAVPDAIKEKLSTCPLCGAGLLYYNNSNGPRARCMHKPCDFESTAKGVIRMWKFQQACMLLDAGYSIREVARAVGHAKRTIEYFKAQLAYCPGEYDEVKCGCGDKAGHRGWCVWRLTRSERRQAYLARFQPGAPLTPD
jgi:hypothetical protein